MGDPGSSPSLTFLSDTTFDPTHFHWQPYGHHVINVHVSHVGVADKLKTAMADIKNASIQKEVPVPV